MYGNPIGYPIGGIIPTGNIFFETIAVGISSTTVIAALKHGITAKSVTLGLTTTATRSTATITPTSQTVSVIQTTVVSRKMSTQRSVTPGLHPGVTVSHIAAIFFEIDAVITSIATVATKVGAGITVAVDLITDTLVEIDAMRKIATSFIARLTGGKSRMDITTEGGTQDKIE